MATVAPPPTGSQPNVNELRSMMRSERARKIALLLPGRGGSTWTGLALRPNRVSFATQNPEEEVLIFLRRHWLTNLSWIFNSALWAVAPLILLAILTALKFDYIQFFGWKVFTILMLAYYSVQFTSTMGYFLDWYYNLYLVTNERIMDYDFQLFKSTSVAEVSVEAVQKVIETSRGFWGTLFGFGDVTAYGEADKVSITFVDAPDPTLVRDKISDLAEAIRETRYDI